TGFVAIGRDMVSLGVSALLAEAVAATGDPGAAALLYEQLLPYAGRYIVNGATPNFYGSASLYLGMLAAVMSRWHAAAAHLDEAARMNERTGVRPLIARARIELAAMLLAQHSAECRTHSLRSGQVRSAACGHRGRALSLLDEVLGTAREL